jgi:hypothetical protein
MLPEINNYEERLRNLKQRYGEALLRLLEQNLDHIIEVYSRAIHSHDDAIALDAIEQLTNRALGYPERRVEITGSALDRATVLHLITCGGKR